MATRSPARRLRVTRKGRDASTYTAIPPRERARLAPMLAEAAPELPTGDWSFEPKLDGIRVLAHASREAVSLVTRNGNDKAGQFPELLPALHELARTTGGDLVLDGEIVGVGSGGEYLRFSSVQGRAHRTGAEEIARAARSAPTALVAFDALALGGRLLLDEPWRARRRALEALLSDGPRSGLRLGESSSDGAEMLARGRRMGWEGVVAKRTGAPYRPGCRSGDWLKVRIENRQELVVGGWTEPRSSRKHFGALLVGYYDGGRLVYAGHVGSGFSERSLSELYPRLRRLARKTPPFSHPPRTNQRAHWVTPRLVVEVKFNEWTPDGLLRHPVYLGVREDKAPREVVREPSVGAAPGGAAVTRQAPAPGEGTITRAVRRRIGAIQAAGGSGTLLLPGGERVEVTNLSKTLFPADAYTKADLLTYYASMSALLLPWMADRPLVLKRFPGGIDAEGFYQQSAPDRVPPGVRAERVRLGRHGAGERRLIGGTLATLLYTIQLGAISYDPWHSRVTDLGSADYTILDLDPGPDASFCRVTRVARWVAEEMDELGLVGAVKTSGATGIHIYLPLTPGTPLEAATLIAQIVATRVARKHPREATVERSVRKRPAGTVYVDYLQNILGKTVAGVYAARARPGATVSTPLRWNELTDDLDPREFTIRTVPDRVRQVGELWSAMMAKPNPPERLIARR